MDLLQLCVLGNLCPETVEEAIAMVPSIKVKIACFSFCKYFLLGLDQFRLFLFSLSRLLEMNKGMEIEALIKES
jgi:hypothetical protein